MKNWPTTTSGGWPFHVEVHSINRYDQSIAGEKATTIQNETIHVVDAAD